LIALGQAFSTAIRSSHDSFSRCALNGWAQVTDKAKTNQKAVRMEQFLGEKRESKDLRHEERAPAFAQEKGEARDGLRLESAMTG
jgi:hypothetical protein